MKHYLRAMVVKGLLWQLAKFGTFKKSKLSDPSPNLLVVVQ